MACHIWQVAPEELDSLVTYLQNAAPITLAALQASLIESDVSAQQQQALTVAARADDATGDHSADTDELHALCADVESVTMQHEDINSDTASSRSVSLDDVADDVAHKVTEAPQCSLQFALDASNDQQKRVVLLQQCRVVM
jgi:hypothetical protein